MKKKLKEAQQIVNLIWGEYEKLNFKGVVSSEYHDILRIQADCSREEFYEMEEYAKRKDLKSVNYILENLQKTLNFCKAIIELQKMEDNLPPCIFG